MERFTFFRIMPIAVGTIVALISLPAYANDGAIFGAGGRVSLLKGEHRSIQMVREDVEIDIHPGYTYTVDARFVFKNHGPATTVTMGFPESGGGADFQPSSGRHTQFLRFTTSVDGDTVPATRRPAKSGSEAYEAFWIKRVRFARGQTRYVRVRYRSYPGGSSSGDSFVTYNFTGGNWKDVVQKSNLTVTVGQPGTLRILADSNGFRYRKGNRFYYRWRNWQAQREFFFSYIDTVPGFLEFPDSAYNESTITIPGDPDGNSLQAHRIPDAFVRQGAVFLELRQCRRRIDAPRDTAARYHDGINWNHKSKAATVGIERHTFRFRLGDRWMIVDKKKRIRLPAAPVLTYRDYRRKYGRLFVPLAPILHVLGTPMTVNRREHRIEIGRTATARE